MNAEHKQLNNQELKRLFPNRLSHFIKKEAIK